ncbi:MAG: hypothetical protein ACJAS2_000270 [Pseudohongiellaceae bacterium]|jgi:hypothetical protein
MTYFLLFVVIVLVIHQQHAPPDYFNAMQQKSAYLKAGSEREKVIPP